MRYDLFRRLAAQTLIALALGDVGFTELAEEHVPIVEALERSDEDAAVQAFVAVVVSTVERLGTRLGADLDGPRAVSGGDLLMNAGVY